MRHVSESQLTRLAFRRNSSQTSLARFISSHNALRSSGRSPGIHSRIMSGSSEYTDPSHPSNHPHHST
eukprot:scaffold463338_cov21-Prasinocladus_malaysianus.AAC.2